MPMYDDLVRARVLAPPPRRGPIIPLLFLSAALCLCVFKPSSISAPWKLVPSPARTNDSGHSASLAFCRQLHVRPEPSQQASDDRASAPRRKSDRYERGTRPVLIKNATIWTGATHNGTSEILKSADILLHSGLIHHIGRVSPSQLEHLNHGELQDLEIINAHGAWLTPGLVNVHSHAGVASSPTLDGADDSNSFLGIVQPWLRALDGLNTHDEAYGLAIAGGVSTALVLPGSVDAIGGQAFVVKLRKTAERSPSSMLVEPPLAATNNSATQPPEQSMHWRHIKHACGENPSKYHDGTRMDTMWAFRKAYQTALELKNQQDAWCAKALSNDRDHGLDGLEPFPEDLQWEALVDVLRGRAKVHTHCYEAVDMDAFVRLSQEFKFPIAAFHHASEAYLVTDVLKQAYGKPPAVALFSTFARYKRESYRSSEYAPRILTDSGFTVLMKTDDPTLNMRYLLHEAQLAHYYGLQEHLALASVTSNAADTLGLGHRIGYIKEGYDADVVLWDSHPLALGATPKQVFIDGIAQLDPPPRSNHRHHDVTSRSQKAPLVPNFDKEAKAAVEHDGLPPLSPRASVPLDRVVVFENVQSVHVVRNGTVIELSPAVAPHRGQSSSGLVAVAVNGTIACYGTSECAPILDALPTNHFHTTIDLAGGSILPGLVSYGCPLGQEHIALEPSTNSGDLFTPVEGESPAAFGEMPIMYAVDGLQYQSRNALLAYRAGITIGVTAPMLPGFMTGLGTSFSLGAPHKLATGAVVQEVTAVHITLSLASRHSVGTQIAALRRLLTVDVGGEVGTWFGKVKEGEIPLVVNVNSADIIATLLVLKKEIEAQTNTTMRLTMTGAEEAHLLAKELSEAQVGVILTPARPFPHTWESRRIIPGPPLTHDTALIKLVENGVMIGLGCEGSLMASAARNLPFDLGWAAIESGGRISRTEAITMGTTNMMQMLGVHISDASVDLVATGGGGLLDLESQVVAILSQRENATYIL